MSYFVGIVMAATGKIVTTLSSKGQVVLPQGIRKKRGWTAGVRLIVEETAEGVLLKPEPLFAPTRLEDVFGCLKYDGPPLSLEDMDAAIDAELRERHARGRY